MYHDTEGPKAPIDVPLEHTFQDGNLSDFMQDQEEFEALGKIAHAFRQYKTDAEWEIKRWELPPAHQQLLPHIPTKIAASRQCIYQNHLFISSMLNSPAPEPLCYAAAAADAWAAQHGPRVHPADADKVRYVLKNMVRDWSAAAQEERKESYGAILEELKSLLLVASSPLNPQQIEKDTEDHDLVQNTTAEAVSAVSIITRPKVLVPGCGLGRLCAELASLGFETIGNEHSYYMLIASSFILNNDVSRAEQWTIAPWVHSCNNRVSDSDQLQPIFIPDVIPSKLIENTAPGLLGMAAGEFTDVFNHKDYQSYFDAVATCFFIDTAHNIIEYLETIWHCLKPGGYWVNLGPLQWHWADSHTYLSTDELSIEISMAEVQRVAQKIGFVILKSETGKRCRYMCDEKSMMHQAYECAMWTAQKPAER